MNFIKVKLTTILFIYHFQINTVSFVYNIKISETTKNQQKVDVKKENPMIAALTSVNQYRTTQENNKESINGGLATLIYSPGNYYLRADFGFGNIKQKDLGFSKTETDDVLLAAGISKKFSEKTNFAFSGILGIPTHKDRILQRFQLGTGHFSLGFQADGAYSYTRERKHLILGAARFIYFLPTNLELQILDNTFGFDFNLGNLADVYIAHQSIWNTNRIEVGYNATFAFNASIHPTIADLEDRAKFIRSSFFASFAHAFKLGNHFAGIILGASYGFDHIPKNFGYKKIISIWLSAGINF